MKFLVYNLNLCNMQRISDDLHDDLHAGNTGPCVKQTHVEIARPL